MEKFFYLLAALPLVFVACENGSEDTDKTPEVKEPVLTLTSEATLDVTAEGGEFEITYTLENEKEGVELTATCEADWVDVVAGDKVSVTVAVNEDVAREATVVVAYDTQKFEVAVKQAAAEQGEEPENPDNPENPENPENPVVEGWAVVGSMTNDWDINAAIAMETIEGYYVLRSFELQTSDGFMFICDGDMDKTRSGNGLAAEANHGYIAEVGGSDIRVAVAGTYDIYLNEDLTIYYVMNEGVDPAEAIAPEMPVENTWSVLGNFEGNSFATDVELVRSRELYVAQDVVFAAEGDLAYKIRKGMSDRDKYNYGVRTKVVREIGEAIQLYTAEEKGRNNVLVNVERGVKYDIYFEPVSATTWIMADGEEPKIEIKWTLVEGVQFAVDNFGVFMHSETHTLNFDFNCGVVSEDGTIPEGTYYVNDTEETGNNFNEFGTYTMFKIHGIDTYPVSGTMEIKHVKGGYEIIIDMVTAHQEHLQTRYEGVIVGNPYMGRPITNPN